MRATIVFLAAVVIPCVASSAAWGDSPSEPLGSLGFVRAYTWGWPGARGSYAAHHAEESMAKLASTGADTVCIAFAAAMESSDSPHFRWGDDARQMITDDELRRAIRLARQHQLKVILKPTVNCADQTWRAWIRFYRATTEDEAAGGIAGVEDPWGPEPGYLKGQTVDMEKWDTWWRNYNDFLCHYAHIAAEESVAAFCLGCEMSSTEHFVDRWRSTIDDVSDIYSGPLTYNCNHGRERHVEWWDALDFIGISAYYDIPPPEGVSIESAIQSITPKEQMLTELASVKRHLASVSQEVGKPILFIEAGVTNVQGCARYPWSHEDAKLASPISDEEQNRYYEAMFEAFWNEPWFMGFCWWDWPARLYPAEEAHTIRSFCVYGRSAEQTLRDWYQQPDRDAQQPSR